MTPINQVEDVLQTMAPRQIKELIAHAVEERQRRILENGIQYYKPLPYQILFHKSTAKVRLVCGGNRPLAYGTKIRMADGSIKLIEDIEVGDIILSWNGKESVPTAVIDIPYDDYNETWCILTGDGEKIEASESHCFPAHLLSKKGIRKHTLKEIKNSKNIYKKLVSSGLQHYTNEEKLPFSGLMLGLFLGDGSCHPTPSAGYPRPNFTNMDDEILGLFKEETEKYYPSLKCGCYPSDTSRLYVRTYKGKGANTLSNELQRLGLAVKSNKKFIPDIFKYSSPETRRGIIRGLIFTDGGVDKRKTCIYSNSLRLLEDVKEVIVSLGGRSRIYKDGIPENINQNQQYKLQFSNKFLDIMNIVGLKRKTPRKWLGRKLSRDDLIVKDVSYVGIKRCRCLTVSNPSHTFILSHGVVTYNSGKTIGSICEAVWYATGTHPYKIIPVPNFGRIVCTDFPTIEKVIIPEIRRWLPKDAVENYSADLRTFYLKCGSTIEMMSYEQSVEKFESASRHWVAFDEEPPEGIYKANQIRLLDTNGDMWFAMTPLHGMSWIYSDLYEQAPIDNRIEVFHYNTRENPHVDNEVIDEISRGLSEIEKDMRFGGLFVSLSGLIYKEFHPDRHVISRFPIPDNWIRLCAIDPHPRNPTVVVYMAVTSRDRFMAHCQQNNVETPKISDDTVYLIYDEVYPKESMLISQVCDVMRAKEGEDQIAYRLIDWSANAPDPIVGSTIRDEFEKHGMRTVLADKNVNNRIFKVREKLNSNSMFFFGDLHKTLWEMRHYVWDDFKIGKYDKSPKEKPRKKMDHAMDALGYLAASSPSFELPEIYRPNRSTADKYTGY